MGRDRLFTINLPRNPAELHSNGGGGEESLLLTLSRIEFIFDPIVRSNNENQLYSLSFHHKLLTCINKYFRRCCEIREIQSGFYSSVKEEASVCIHSAERVSSERFEGDRKPCAPDTDEIEASNCVRSRAKRCSKISLEKQFPADL